MEFLLDEYQHKCVYSDDSKLIVVAGAGSGKTRVLTERIKRLLLEGVCPSSVVAITYTNAAADEMKERLSSVPGIKGCFIGTIHSYANKIMKYSGKRYNLLTEDAEIDIYCQFISRYCTKLQPKYFLKCIQDYKKECREKGIVFHIQDVLHKMPEDLEQEFSPIFYNKKTSNINYTVSEYIKYNNFLTFSQLIEETTKYLAQNDVRIKHLLVDEFQDVSYPEVKFFDSLNSNNVFYCGDPRQSIYGFKGSDVRIMMKLIDSGDYTVYELNNNYRTYENIVRKAEQCLIGCQEISCSPAVCTREGSGTFAQKPSYMINNVLRDIYTQDKYSNWALLVRSNRDAVYLENLCRNIGLPCAQFKRQDLSLEELRNIMSSNVVKILTVHTAKGLEFDNVVLYGNFPLQTLTLDKDSSWEEERRVMYVGMTRAKNALYLMSI